MVEVNGRWYWITPPENKIKLPAVPSGYYWQPLVDINQLGRGDMVCYNGVEHVCTKIEYKSFANHIATLVEMTDGAEMKKQTVAFIAGLALVNSVSTDRVYVLKHKDI